MNISPAISLVDTPLAVLNIFNVFTIFSHLHPVESPLKKPAVRTVHKIVSKAHSIPFACTATLLAIAATCAWSAMSYQETSDVSMLIRAIVCAYTLACTCVLMKISHYMIQTSVDAILDLERELTKNDILGFKPLSPALIDAALAPAKPLFSIQSTGLERIPSNTPHFFVSNHSLYGIEMPFFINHLYQNKGIYLRGLADHFHFATPNGKVLRLFGAVDGTRDNVDLLMNAGQNVLVYPGGGHEVLKNSKVPRYELMWRERLGFARMAIKHGYPVLPCACVGVEDMFDPLADIPTGYKGMTIPITVTTPCRVQRIYFWFGNPIPTKDYAGDFGNDDFAREVRDKTKAAIEAGIKELQEKQEKDPDRYLMDRISSKIKGNSSISSLDGQYNTETDNETEKIKTT